MDALLPTPPSPQCIRRLMRQMGSKNAAIRAKALEQLRSYGPSALEPLLHFADAEYKRWGNRAMAIICLQSLPVVCFNRITQHYPIWLDALIVIPVCFIWMFCLSKFLMRGLRLNQVIGVLAEYEDMRVIRFLIHAQHLPNMPMRSTSKQALLRLLPRMKPSNFIGFDERQHIWLRQLASRSDPELAVACLRALAWTTDKGALKQVQKLLAGSAKTPLTPDVQDAALECLHALEARMKGMTPDSVLLRGTSPPQKPEVLLRPADGTNYNEPQQLLRASDGSPADIS